MKSPSKGGGQPSAVSRQRELKPFIAGVMALLFAWPIASPARASSGLFSVVPAGDSTYAELKQLAQAGWLSSRDVAPSSLTRFDVAELIVKAEMGSGERATAQAGQSTPVPDDLLLPPPENMGPSATSTPTGPETLSAAQKAAARTEAEKILHSLEEAYRYELGKITDKVKGLEGMADDLDKGQYDLRRHLKGISQYPTIAIHGLGRAFGLSHEYSGNVPSFLSTSGVRAGWGYLDLNPQGTVSKEIRWNSLLRLGSDFTDFDPPTFLLRRMSLEFNPSWLSATFGDFDESYTPLTLWNRDSLDLRYAPEMWARQDDEAKYEGFLNREPDLPFRGLRIGESLMWPDSSVLESLKASVFADMIRSGFDVSDLSSGWYFGPNQFTDWAFGGRAGIKSRKWYSGGTSWQWSLDAYGVILDEPLDTSPPGSPYNPGDPATWAHQYLIGSVKPGLEAGLGGGVDVGAAVEYAYSSYQDDKLNPQSVVADYAVMGGAYARWGDSKISVNYLDVQPHYYSPLAQTRQDAVTTVPDGNSGTSPDLFATPLRGQYFLSDVPRAGAIFSFYDRTLDDTFPYGLATPNRKGVGLEMDVRTLEKGSLKIKGSAYLVSEIDSNLVLGPGQVFAAVDAPSGVFTTRSFTYVNLGPSFNIGPAIGFDRDLEVGANVRYEQTTSTLGTLTSTWVIGGVRADVLPFWEVSAAFSQRNANGTEWGYGGTLWARTPYLFDASDLGQYSAFTVDGSVQSLRLSTTFKVNRHSNIYLDYDWTTGNMLPGNPSQGTVNNQFTELTYQVEF